ncbi:MAG: ABC transporter permease subunit [Parachlamydiales bacterium]|nr:ABC transporter permease subunit [Parachlamydiales bacterium]
MKSDLKYFIILLFLASFFYPTSNYGQNFLRWGADPSGGAPYVSVDPMHPNQYIGFEAEIADALAKELGKNAELISTQWESLLPALNRAEFDVILNGLEATSDRAKHILFSRPYYFFQFQLSVHKKDHSITELNDCQNKIVGALANSAASRYLIQENIPVHEYSDPMTPYDDLLAGRIDAVLADLPIAKTLTENHPLIKCVGKPFYRGAYIIGIPKELPELKEEVDNALIKLTENGTLKKILSKWGLWTPLQQELSDEVPTYSMTSVGFNWPEALQRLTKAAGVTILIAFGSMILAIVVGIPISVLQTHGPKWSRIFCAAYIEFFRGTPIVVQLLFLYFGLPTFGIKLSGWLTALIGLGLNYAAYESQIYRAAFEAIPKGQWEAAFSLGMNRFQAFCHIILPQAFRTALPPMTNDFVSLFKDTSVAFAISVWELATAYRELSNACQEFFALGVITCGFYMAMSLPLSRYARYLENSFNTQHQKPLAKVKEAPVILNEVRS